MENKRSLYAGSTLPLKITGVSTQEFRLDIIAYVTGATSPVAQASTDPDIYFTETISILDEKTFIYGVRGEVTKDLSGQILRIERRYTNRQTGYRKVMADHYEIKPAVIGDQSIDIAETYITAEPVVIRDTLYTSLSRYEDAVRHGFAGTEEEWLASLTGSCSLSSVEFPRLELRISRGYLQYRFTNFTQGTADDFKIGIQRYTTKGSFNKRKWTTVDDANTIFAPIRVSESFNFDTPNVVWTEQRIRPWDVDLSEPERWQNIPYNASDLVSRFVYAKQDDYLEKLEHALVDPHFPGKVKIPGTKGKIIRRTGLPFRYRMYFRLVVFKTYQEEGDETGKNITKPIFSQPCPFAVYIAVDANGKIDMGFELK